MATTDRWRQRTERADPDDERRWLAPDAKPATMTVLDVLERADESITVDELATATGFTTESVDRIVGDLTTVGVVDEQFRGRHASRYRCNRKQV